MQKLIVRHFGPIENIEIVLTKIIILNGVQSSGKSTLSKLIYLQKSLPEVIFKYLTENKIQAQSNNYEYYQHFTIVLRKWLISVFGTTKHFHKNFFIQFIFDMHGDITITKEPRSKHARVRYSLDMQQSLVNIFKKYANFIIEQEQNQSDFSATYASKLQFLFNIKQQLQSLFGEHREPVFIPAGRSLVSTLSDELKKIESYNIDFLTQEFVKRVSRLRETFSKDLDEMVEDRRNLTNLRIDFKKVKLAKSLFSDILQGSYRYENGEEQIHISSEEYVKMKFSSSGQQESLWILNLLFIYILNKQESFIVFEEPEAHLYPSTQYEIVKLISLFLSLNGNEGVITTHSPYVVASINNLLTAQTIAKQSSQSQTKDALKAILPSDFWLDSRDLSAYFVEDGKAKDIFDKESGLIDPAYIDRASERLNEDFNLILDLDSTQ